MGAGGGGGVHYGDDWSAPLLFHLTQIYSDQVFFVGGGGQQPDTQMFNSGPAVANR